MHIYNQRSLLSSNLLYHGSIFLLLLLEVVYTPTVREKFTSTIWSFVDPSVFVGIYKIWWSKSFVRCTCWTVVPFISLERRFWLVIGSTVRQLAGMNEKKPVACPTVFILFCNFFFFKFLDEPKILRFWCHFHAAKCLVKLL